MITILLENKKMCLFLARLLQTVVVLGQIHKFSIFFFLRGRKIAHLKIKEQKKRQRVFFKR